MFNVIKKAHIATGPGGRDKMSKEIRKKYAKITDDVITLFKSFCTECELKKNRLTTKGTVVRPLLTKEFCSRGQVDLIDMQSIPHGDMKFIMVYQDHLTKLCVLQPLPSKRAVSVSIFWMFSFLVLVLRQYCNPITARNLLHKWCLNFVFSGLNSKLYMESLGTLKARAL